MHLSSGSEEESEISGLCSPDAIQAFIKTIEGLAELAALEGLDSVVDKLDEAVEECEKTMMKGIYGIHPTSQ